MLAGHWKFSNLFSAELFCVYIGSIIDKKKSAQPHNFLAAVGYKGRPSPPNNMVHFASLRPG